MIDWKYRYSIQKFLDESFRDLKNAFIVNETLSR